MGGLRVISANAGDQIVDSALQACGDFCNTNLTVGSIFLALANTLTFLLGAGSVIMLIIAGLRYTISSGDAKQVAEAKNTILYAITGVVVSISAYAIVSFVIDALG